MDIKIETDRFAPEDEIRIGNVYHVRGGRGLRYGHMNIVIAITEPTDEYRGRMALCITVTKEGRPVGCTSYGIHYFKDKQPISFCDGCEDISLIVRSL
jgi:hypothetical protein